MAGFERYDTILRLFLDEKSSWTVAELSVSLETSISNVYRTVRELVAAGFLESAADSHYRLGPIFLEFEHRLRETDPLVRSGRLFLMTLVEHAGVPCCAVLARLYGNTVMCVADAQSSGFDGKTSYQRGAPMPVLRGATSKAILAGLPTRKRDRLLEKLTHEVPDSLNEQLATIRKSGLAVSRGEVDRDLLGIAVPVQLKNMVVHASLSFVVKQVDATPLALARLEALLKSHAKLIENFLEEETAVA